MNGRWSCQIHDRSLWKSNQRARCGFYDGC